MSRSRRIIQAAALLMLFTAGSAQAYDVSLKPFGDVTGEEWFQNEVYSLSVLGLIDGYPDAGYKPDGLLTREAFIKLLVQASGVSGTGPAGTPPQDVGAERWSYPYITAAQSRQWIDFMLDAERRLRPEQVVTREEVAAAVGRSLLGAESEELRSRWTGGDWEQERQTRAFPDDPAMNEPLRPYVYYAVQRGILEGDEHGFRPRDPLSRKEAAVLFYRMIDRAVSAHKLETTGFYAIGSYPALHHMPRLNHVSYGWSHLEYAAPGKAELRTNATEYRIPQAWEEAVQVARDAGVDKSLMIYSGDKNLAEFLKDAAARKSFMDSLKGVLGDQRYGFTGVTMDFEGLREASNASDYTAFLKELKAGIPGYTLTVAVQPDYYYKGYELREIGALADTVILMAYDFTHDDSRLPSAPLPLVNDALQRTLEEIPADKLVLGISKQANQWVTLEGQTKSYSPAIADVEKRLQAPGTIQEESLPYFVNHVSFQDDRGSHEMYYEDTESISKKLWLAKYYKLKGVSLWHMGNFTDADWKLFAAE